MLIPIIILCAKLRSFVRVQVSLHRKKIYVAAGARRAWYDMVARERRCTWPAGTIAAMSRETARYWMYLSAPPTSRILVSLLLLYFFF